MEIVISESITLEEIESAKDYLKEKYPDCDIIKIELIENGEFIDIKFWEKTIPFERIRRISGYLVGSLDKWNNAKKAEEKARVKHM